MPRNWRRRWTDLSYRTTAAVFGAHFSRVHATAYYPTKPNDAVGGGTLTNFDIKKHSK